VLMNKTILTTLIFLFSYCLGAFAAEKGNLVIIGGGARPAYVVKKIVELAGGKNARLIIIPNASGEPLEVALNQKKEFEKYDPARVDYLIFSKKEADTAKNLDLMERATGIFFSGGDQEKLIASLKGTRLFDKIQALYYEKGGVISGTSAGAAVMSKIMLTGVEIIHKAPDFTSIQQKNVQTEEGFGFVSKAIIDQHFIVRKRQNRLISLALENPGLPCIGIDEATAVIVKPNDTLTVLGEGTVMVFDAAKAKNIRVDKNKNLSGLNIIMHILQSGDSFNLDNRQVTPGTKKND
jgi:cyanophycinase